MVFVIIGFCALLFYKTVKLHAFCVDAHTSRNVIFSVEIGFT